MFGSSGFINKSVESTMKPKPGKELVATMAAVIYAGQPLTVKQSVQKALEIIKEVDCL